MDYSSLQQRIRGPIYSIITPFCNNGKDVDYDSLRNYIKFMYDGGGRIFYAMAFNTRYLLMSEQEIMDVNKFVIEEVKKLDATNVVIVGDPLHCSTDTSIRFAQHAKQHGADMISLIFRAYIFDDDQVYAHYKKVADEVSDIGILVHEMPFARGIPDLQDGSWSLSLIDRLAEIPAVVAMKEDAKDDDYTRKVVDTISDRVAIITSGNGLQQWSKVSDKCQAWLTGIGNFAPKTEIDFYKAHLDGNNEVCDNIIENIEKPFFWVKDNLGWHLGIKSALDYYGIMDRQERMPYIALSEEKHKAVCVVMDKIKPFLNN